MKGNLCCKHDEGSYGQNNLPIIHQLSLMMNRCILHDSCFLLMCLLLLSMLRTHQYAHFHIVHLWHCTLYSGLCWGDYCNRHFLHQVWKINCPHVDILHVTSIPVFADPFLVLESHRKQKHQQKEEWLFVLILFV